MQIAVEDEGHGVAEAEREVIFDRFSRGSEGGNRASDSGVGLGLALVDEHVRLHGGGCGSRIGATAGPAPASWSSCRSCPLASDEDDGGPRSIRPHPRPPTARRPMPEEEPAT